MKVAIETTVTVPIEDVWRTWTTLDDIRRWNAAAADSHCPDAGIDPRPGGRSCYRMAARDGSMEIDFSGTFTKVIPNERIEFSFGDKRSVTVEFLASDELVTVRETFDAEASHCAAQQQQGWQALLDNFARHVYAQE